MKLIEFVNKKEGEVISDAWLTFGRFDGTVGLYISFCILAVKMTRQDFMTDRTIYGWYARRVWFGFRYKKQLNWLWKSYWVLIKSIHSISREEIMDANNA